MATRALESFRRCSWISAIQAVALHSLWAHASCRCCVHSWDWVRYRCNVMPELLAVSDRSVAFCLFSHVQDIFARVRPGALIVQVV